MSPQPRPLVRIMLGPRIEIRLHASLLVVMALVTVVMATGMLPESPENAGRPPLELWLIGAGCGLLLFVSVAVHEIAHALADRLRKPGVTQVSLVFLHSGHPPLPEEGATPWTEIVSAAAGPLATLALGLGALGAQSLVPDRAFAAPLLAFLAVANLLLAGAQLVPGHPLDGFRALRAIAWALSGDAGTGTRWASRVSLAFSIMTGATCAVMLPLAGVFSWPLWGLLMSLMLGMQSVAIARLARARERLSGLLVAHVVQPLPEPLPRVLAIDDVLASSPSEAAYLVEFQGRLGGIVTLHALHSVPEEERRQTPVGQVTRKLERQHLLTPALPLESALRRMIEERLPLLPVLDAGALIGVVRQESVSRLLAKGGA